MWRSALDTVCLLCRASVGPNLGLRPLQQLQRPNQPWMSQRFLSTRRGRTAPSRMVLSDRVARPPPSRGDAVKAPRRGVDGPFAGMNRTVANINPSRETSRSTGRDTDRRDRKRRDFKALKMQRSLATIGYGRRTHIKSRMQEIESFDYFELLPAIKEALSADALKGMVDVKPTPVQRLAIPVLLGQKVDRRARPSSPAGRQDFLLAAETGSGKTLAYLLPCINAVKTAEAEDPDIVAYKTRIEEERERRRDPKYRGSKVFEPHPTTARPAVVVLVPTAELVDQVGAVAKSLAHAVKFRSERLSSSLSAKVIEQHLYSPSGIDVVVATPHLLASIAESDPNVLSRVSHLVIDEADSLLDRSFSPVTTKILDRAKPSLKQLILCSATIPKGLDKYLAGQFPDLQRITTPNLHAIPRRVQLGVVDVSKDPYRNNKNLACADAIWSIGKEAAKHETTGSAEIDVKRIMVFVNEREKTEEVAAYLKSKGIDAVALNRDSAEQRQSEMLAAFTTSEALKVDTAAAAAAAAAAVPNGRRSLPNTKVIVATDLASRGIDTLAVRHVVLYDVPHTSIDFIHRLGRAGRMGRRGRGVVLVGKNDRRDIVAEVKESMYMGQALV